MSDPKTLSIYAEKAKEYAELTDAVNETDPRLAAFISAMPDGGEVLDLGCGPGASAARMAKEGLKVIAYDPVPQMVALANQHEGVSAHEASFDDVSGMDLYDGVWANFSLLHAPRKDLPRILERIVEALKIGGRFHISVKTGTGAHRDGLGRLYTYYTEDELKGLLQDAGLSIIDRAEGSDKGLSGEEAHWIALAATRA